MKILEESVKLFVENNPHCDCMEIVMSPQLIEFKTYIVVNTIYDLVDKKAIVEHKDNKKIKTGKSISTFSVL